MGLFDFFFRSRRQPAPPPAPNPLVAWQQQLQKAQALMAELRYRETAVLLTDLLIDVRDLRGSGADALVAVTLGYLGECYFQAGEAEKALAPTTQALERCQRNADADGIIAYLGNLYEMYRWLGQPAPAADYAVRLADAVERQGRPDEAARYRRQAQLVRAGEPLNRVVVDMDGKRFELEEAVARREGRVRFLFERNRLTLRPATVLTERGEREASQGRFEPALELFREAARADRFAPQPHYQAGRTLLYLQRPIEAIESYEATEERAPGWFHCRSDLWLARQLLLGKVAHETFVACHALEDGPLSPEAKVRLAEQALAAAPDLAPLHYQLGKARRDLGQAAEAQRAYRRGLACVEEPDLQTRLLVDLAVAVDGPEEKQNLLKQALSVNGNLVASAMATVVLALE